MGRAWTFALIDAAEEVGMAEKVGRPTLKKRSSILIGVERVGKGEADAFFSAGNTAACWTIAKMTLGTLPEIDRPALTAVVPNIKGKTVLLDVGANATCKSRHLEEFAVMGSLYAEEVLKIASPRVGLMSMGEEESKGTDLTREVHAALKESHLNFVGNVEGHEIYNGDADVVVMDGFTGNVILKSSETLASSIVLHAEGRDPEAAAGQDGSGAGEGRLQGPQKAHRSAGSGRRASAGDQGCCVIGHGKSDALAICEGIRTAGGIQQERHQVEDHRRGGSDFTHGRGGGDRRLLISGGSSALNLRSDGKIAIVTGASRGIGRGISIALAEAGATVICAARDLSKLLGVVAEITARGGKAHAQAVDVGSRESIEGLISSTVAAHGRIDILVNNAGITRDGLLLRMKAADWDDVIATNLTGVFVATQTVMKAMLKQRAGSIINIGSVVGLCGNAGQANYAAAKAGLIGFSKSVAREVASRGIRVNVVAPGFIDTDMTRALPDAAKQALLSAIPLGRTGTCEDVAAVVVYLASDAAAYVTGQTISVDGGFHM